MNLVRKPLTLATSINVKKSQKYHTKIKFMLNVSMGAKTNGYTFKQILSMNLCFTF